VAEEALDEYNELYMKPGDDYAKFKNEFVRLAGECNKPRTEWKSEFKRKVLPAISDKMVMAFLDKKVAFEEYARTGAQIALDHKITQKRRDRDRKKTSEPAGPTPGRGYCRGTKSMNDKATSAKEQPGQPARVTRNAEEIKQLAREGRCFTCREQGHRSSDCPKREARLQEIADRYTKDPATSNKAKLDATKSAAKKTVSFVEPTDTDDEEDSDSEN
jgi:hypothetical protein